MPPAECGAWRRNIICDSLRGSGCLPSLRRCRLKKKLQAKLSAKAERGCGVCRWTLFLGPKALALFLLVWSTVQLLSSTFRSFLYFQF